MLSYRLALPALCLSLLLPCALPVVAAETVAETPTETAEAKPLERQPLLERSQEDAAALERQLPIIEQQQLQAGDEAFLALWKPANSSNPDGVVIIVPGAGETADWPRAVGPLRNKLPDANWASLSLSLPDLQSEASQARLIEPAASTVPAPDSTSKEASTTVKPVEQIANTETELAKPESAVPTPEALAKTDADRIFKRLDAALAFAQQQDAHQIVLLGHGTGGYWAARYLSEKQPAGIQKLVLVAVQTPATSPPELAQLTSHLKIPTLDLFYKERALARDAAVLRAQGSKRVNGSDLTQVGLVVLPGNRAAEQEQLFRRIRGWLSPQPANT